MLDAEDREALLTLGGELRPVLRKFNAEAAIGYCQLAVASVCVSSLPPHAEGASWSEWERHVVGVRAWVCATRFQQSKPIVLTHPVCRLDVVHFERSYRLLGCSIDIDEEWRRRDPKRGFPVLDDRCRRQYEKRLVPLSADVHECVSKIEEIMAKDGDYVDTGGRTYSADGRNSTDVYSSFQSLNLGKKSFLRKRRMFVSKYSF